METSKHKAAAHYNLGNTAWDANTCNFNINLDSSRPEKPSVRFAVLRNTSGTFSAASIEITLAEERLQQGVSRATRPTARALVRSMTCWSKYCRSIRSRSCQAHTHEGTP